jgi:hypothetical protein
MIMKPALILSGALAVGASMLFFVSTRKNMELAV